MKNTRIYDRAPIKDVRVKDPLIGTRTPLLLMSRKDGEYLRGDILDANATTELAKSIHMPDIDKINLKLELTINKDQVGKPNGVAGLDSTGNVPIDQLANISTDLFIVVSELPTEDIKEGKIYCIKDTSSTAQDNSYIEYAYINSKWEKIGQFQAEPNLSGYAKLSGANFTGDVNLNTSAGSENNLFWMYSIINRNPFNAWIRSYDGGRGNLVYESTGNRIDVGSKESFIFTLEDGTQVTKSIRVISTTTSEAGA